MENWRCKNGLTQSSSFRRHERQRNIEMTWILQLLSVLSATLSFALIAMPINLSQCQLAFNLFHFFALHFWFLWRKDVRQSMDLCECFGYLGYYGNEIISLQSPVCAPPDTVRPNLLPPRLKQNIRSATGVRRTVLGRCSFMEQERRVCQGKCVHVKCWNLEYNSTDCVCSCCDYLMIHESRKKPEKWIIA